MPKNTSLQDDATRQLADQLHSVAIHVLRDARQHDPDSGLPPMQLSALSVLVYKGPSPLSRLAEIEQVRAPTMHSTVEALTKKGLVTRARDKRDRRIVYVVATRAGSELLEQARALRLNQITSRLEKLDSDVTDHLQHALSALLETYSESKA